MRFLFRWIFRLLILIIVLAIGLFLTKDSLTKWWIVSEFREQGMDVQIGQLEIGFPLNSTIAANKITVFNLPEYGGSSMLATMIGFGIVLSAKINHKQMIA